MCLQKLLWTLPSKTLVRVKLGTIQNTFTGDLFCRASSNICRGTGVQTRPPLLKRKLGTGPLL